MILSWIMALWALISIYLDMLLHLVTSLVYCHARYFEIVMTPSTSLLFFQVNSQLISNMCTDALSAEKVIITHDR